MESPLADRAVEPLGGAGGSRRVLRPWLVVAGVFVILAIGGYFLFERDPYRAHEAFPVNTYFSGYGSLVGARFKVELRVENDLGYESGVGRLMVFLAGGEGVPLTALVTGPDAEIFFTKGQRYVAEAGVTEDGLVKVSGLIKR